MLGISSLDMSMVRNAYPVLHPSVRQELERAEMAGDAALQVALSRHKSYLLRTLGFTASELPELSPSESAALDIVYEYLQRAGEWNSMKEAIAAAEGENPAAFYLWVKAQYKPEYALQKLYDTYGECTPQLAALLVGAPVGVPFSIHLLHAGECAVPDVRDVSEDFMFSCEEPDDSIDIQDAIMEAYVRESLSTFFQRQEIVKFITTYRTRGVRRYFPEIVWSLSGYKMHPVEETIL